MREKFDAAAAALRCGDWLRARQLAVTLIPEMPLSGAPLFMAGIAALELRQLAFAIEFLSRAASLAPTRADYLSQFSRALVAARRNADALSAAEKAWALRPQDPATLAALGAVFSQLTEHAKAAEVFQSQVDLEPSQAGHRFNLATSLVFMGNAADAETQLEECLRLDPAFWKAYPALAKLRRQTADGNHVERLLAVLPEAPDPGAAIYVHMALAKEFEDLGQYPSAFEHLVQGKAPIRAAKGYSISRDAAMFEAIERTYAKPMPSASGHQSGMPIFVFGMPRSGTTLVERILTTHSDVQSAGELENFGLAMKRASGSTTPFMLDPHTILRSRQLDWAAVGGSYVASTKLPAWRKPRFVDKLPQNFLYAGYIANALPMARMICVRRNPMDTCLGNFRQLFALESPYYDYSLDILDTGRFYILFDRLMSHWDRVLPARILTIDYETLVCDQESSTRNILDFCGLDWQQACLRFEENPSSIASASTLQVREAMNSGSIGRWKKYESELRPLRQLLENAGIATGD